MKSYTKGGQGQKSYGQVLSLWYICNKKLYVVIEFIDNNRDNHDIKTMCTVLGVARSTYYKFFDKNKSPRQIENKELIVAIVMIYGAPRIHHILGTEGFNVSLKRVKGKWLNLIFVQ